MVWPRPSSRGQDAETTESYRGIFTCTEKMAVVSVDTGLAIVFRFRRSTNFFSCGIPITPNLITCQYWLRFRVKMSQALSKSVPVKKEGLEQLWHPA